MSERALSGAGTVGWHGKLPSRGDFISGGARSGLIEGWRAWASESMNASVSRNTEADHAFLVSPIWRFACAPGFFAPSGGVGLMMPGTDRVGRLFPFVVAAEVARLRDPARAITAARRWYEETEPLMTAALDPAFDPTCLNQQLGAPPPIEVSIPSEPDLTAVFVAARQEKHCPVHGAPTVALFSALFGQRETGLAQSDEPQTAP